MSPATPPSRARVRIGGGRSWLIFGQALSLGGNVRKGERGTAVVYVDRFGEEQFPHPGQIDSMQFPAPPYQDAAP